MKIEYDEDMGYQNEEEEEEPPFEWKDTDTNLVATFSQTQVGQEHLKRIATFMKTSFDEEWEAQTERREKDASDWKIFLGHLKKKTYPYDNCANVNVPIAYENIIRLGFRIIGELFGDWQKVVGVLPNGPQDKKEAELKEHHTNWQMTEQIKDFPRQMEKLVFRQIYAGDVTCHSYRDPDTNTNRHEILTSDEFLVPNSVTSCMPDYSDSPFVCRILSYTDQKLETYRGVWFGIDDILNKKGVVIDDELETPAKDAANEVHGIEATDSTTHSLHKIIQWVGYMNMPGESRHRYVQGYLHHRTNKLLQLTVHERTPFSEVERFERQSQELEQYRQGMENYENIMRLTMDAEAAALENPLMPSEAKIDMSMGQRAVPPPPPIPAWLEDPDDPKAAPRPPKKEPVFQFTHGVLIEPQEGTIGYGFGRLVADLNIAANTLIDQYVDAATVNNVNEIIKTAEVQFEKPFQSRPGAVHTVKGATANDLQRNIMVMPKGTANSQLRELVEALIKWGQGAPQSPELLSGAPGKSGETYRGIAIRSEHATKQLSVITRKVANVVTYIYKQNARLNAVFMDEEEFFAINDFELGEMRQMSIGRKLYQQPYNVFFRSDMAYSTQSEKIMKADEVLGLVMRVPQLQHVPDMLKNAIVQALEARDEHAMAQMVKQADFAAIQQAMMSAQAPQEGPQQ